MCACMYMFSSLTTTDWQCISICSHIKQCAILISYVAGVARHNWWTTFYGTTFSIIPGPTIGGLPSVALRSPSYLAPQLVVYLLWHYHTWPWLAFIKFILGTETMETAQSHCCWCQSKGFQAGVSKPFSLSRGTRGLWCLFVLLSCQKPHNFFNSLYILIQSLKMALSSLPKSPLLLGCVQWSFYSFHHFPNTSNRM